MILSILITIIAGQRLIVEPIGPTLGKGDYVIQGGRLSVQFLPAPIAEMIFGQQSSFHSSVKLSSSTPCLGQKSFLERVSSGFNRVGNSDSITKALICSIDVKGRSMFCVRIKVHAI
jgi:hypothetical protein